MPRALVVCPGPEFSVADVYHGWIKGLQLCGYDVMPYDLGTRLTWAHHAYLKRMDGTFQQAFPELEDVAGFGVSGIAKAAYYWWPELVVFISGFYIDYELVKVMQARNCKVVCVFTESPYEDTRQLAIADTFDAVMVNDPTQLDAYKERTTALYSPHCYDPDIHHPGPSDHKSDVAFVGTGYPSRQAFMERVDWSGIDLALAGNWEHAPEALQAHVIHDVKNCVDNTDTASIYRGTKASFSLNRAETNGDLMDTADGWAIGPREVELAACGTWFPRQSRGESDALFGDILPTFSSPEELGDLLRWGLAHPDETKSAAEAARAAIADRTFDKNARELIRAVGL